MNRGGDDGKQDEFIHKAQSAKTVSRIACGMAPLGDGFDVFAGEAWSVRKFDLEAKSNIPKNGPTLIREPSSVFFKFPAVMGSVRNEVVLVMTAEFLRQMIVKFAGTDRA